MTKKKKLDNNAGEGGAPPKLDDKFRRCGKCFISKDVYGQPDVGNIMIVETVRLHVQNGPNVDVAKSIRCGNVYCDNVSDVFLYRAGIALGINKATVYMLLRARHATPTFTLDELKSGRLDPIKLSDNLTAMLSRPSPTAPKFGEDYNPDEYTEPGTQTEFPL